MKTIAISIIVALLSVQSTNERAPAEGVIAVGQQPQIASDNKGNIRIIYGHEDRIYCATSIDKGSNFPDIQQIGRASCRERV